MKAFLKYLLTAMAVLVVGGFAGAQPLPEVVIWIKSGPEADALTESARVYQEQTGNPVLIEVLGRAGFRSRYETTLLSGDSSVDGVHDIARQIPTLAAGGLIASLDEFILNDPDYDTSPFPQIVQREMKFNDSWYMAPTDTSLETLVYRTDLIPSPPATWEELRENAQTFTQSINPDSPTRYGYAYSAGPFNVIGAGLGIMGAYGGGILDENSCVIVDSPETTEAWEFYIGLKNEDNVTPPDITAWDYPELLVALQEGLVAQASFFTAGMPILTDCSQSPNVCENIALVAQPAGPAGSATRVNPLGIMVNAASPRKEATWEFLKWLTGPEGSLIYTQSGGLSPHQEVLSRPEIERSIPWLDELARATEDGVGSLRHAEANAIREIFDRWISQAVAGSMEVDDALSNAGRELRSFLGPNEACEQ